MNEGKEKEFNEIVAHLKKEYGWDLSKCLDVAAHEALVDYTIKSVKNVLINTPHTKEFDVAVTSEMAHHVQRYGDEGGKYPQDFQMVLSYITGKLIKAIWDGDLAKYEHHLITLAAVSGTAHKYLKKDSNTQRWFGVKQKSSFVGPDKFYSEEKDASL